MNGVDAPHQARRPRACRAGFPVLALVGITTLSAACGSGSASPGVASVGSKSSTTVAGGAAGNSGPSTLTPEQLQTLTAFAACVREHGLPSFPDPPYSNGELNKLGFRKYSPQMVGATNACHADALAAGVVQTPAEIQQHLEQMLKIAGCMRANGVTNFPDPDAQGAFTAPVGGSSSNMDNSPQYAAAAKKCDGPP
jgi:hypothetical protein